MEPAGREPQACSPCCCGAARADCPAVERDESATREVVLFGDYVCAFSYLTTVRLSALAARLRLSVERRAFELSPLPGPVVEPMAEESWHMVRKLAAADGLDIVRSRMVPRTGKAHEAVKYAATQGMAAAMDRAVFDAYFLRGEDIGRIDVLVAIAASLGMDAMAVKIALDLDVHADDVARDRVMAEQLEITGTPALLAGSEVHVGLLSAEQLIDWLGE